jgi:hypothetical protein
VAACSGFFTRAAAHCGGGAALLHWAVLQVQPPLEVQPVDVTLALATRGRAARGRGRLPAAVAGRGVGGIKQGGGRRVCEVGEAGAWDAGKLYE